MSEQTWEAPPEGSICWIEIPGRDIDKLKVSLLDVCSPLMLTSRKEFYAALFPSWKFKEAATNAEDGHKVHQYMFERPDGLSGGIVEMPQDCPSHNQSMGAGFTNYYLVNDVDEVSSL